MSTQGGQIGQAFPAQGGVRGGWEGVSPVSSSHERQSTRDSGGFVKRFEFEKGDGGIEPCILAIGIGSLPPHPCLYFVHCHRPLCTMSKASFACQLGEIHAWQVRDCSKKAQVVVTCDSHSYNLAPPYMQTLMRGLPSSKNK